ncbi:MAG: hypothetical protein IKJ96_06890 [Alistipes sp.]|nr:hypothetical protein [Alistipes sp.]
MFRFSALLCAMAVLVTSCTKDETLEPQREPIAAGDEIIFGARAGFENSGNSRTVYGDYTIEDGKRTFQAIDWVNGTDLVQIYYDKGANDNNTVSYKIVEGSETVNDETTTFSYLQKMSANGLQWGSGDSHTFYAMYPAPEMIPTESTLAQGIKMTGTTLNGYVPQAQNPVSVTEDNGNYVAAPDMTYAYMAAKKTVTSPQSSVSLTFVPIVTAVEIELEVPTTPPAGTTAVKSVQIAEIQVEGEGIAGAFTADLSSWTGTYPTCTNIANTETVTTNAIDQIQIAVWQDSKPITLAAGKSLTFTVFLRPGTKYTNLKVNISPNGAGYIGKQMTGLNINQHFKTIINNVKLPAAGVAIDASKWMSQLDPATQMKKLSLPGTGGSFSYSYSDENDNPSWYKQQTLTFEEQWAAGIRAFEIVSDRPSSASTSLGSQNVKCNKVSMGVTVLQVLQNLLAKVATVDTEAGETSPTECAVLILTYQPEGVWGNARNASNYAKSLKLMYDGLTATQKAQIIQYTPDLTLEKAKGNVMIFCRINQKDEPEDGSFTDATTTLAGTNITLIDGCGTGKDRWGSRGYKVNGNVAYDAANTGDADKSVDYYLTQQGSWTDLTWPAWSNVTVPNYSNSNQPMAFGFPTNYSAVTCWYQEWARVVPETIIDPSLGWYQVYKTGAGIADIYADYRWYESYNEKVNAAETTFEMAISDKYPSYVFINSLCGYLVDTAIESSYTIFTGSNTGGIAGNIKALADKINPAFYQYVLSAGMEQATGPTGIVMMDYVTKAPTDGVEYDGSYLLPGVIIANNFKFTTTGGGTSGGQTGGGSGSGEGGSVGGVGGTEGI